MNDIKIKLPKHVKFIINHLNMYNFDAYIVGGCVRDHMLGVTPKDWDICTSAKPHEVMCVFEGFRIIETGIKHGTVTLIIEDAQYEITTFRTESVYSDNRHPDEVKFVDTIDKDLERRDFTMNAMAYNDKDGLIDPFHGIDAIRNKTIECVGNPNTRFSEDALRILRVMRFSVQLDYEIEVFTSVAMHNNVDLINNLSKERINSELVKMLCSRNNISDCFIEYRDIISTIIPEFRPCIGFNQNNPHHKFSVYDHIIRATDIYDDDDIVVKLALLLHDIGKPSCYTEDENHVGHFIDHAKISSEMVNSILRDLRFDNKTIDSVTELVLYHDLEIDKFEVKQIKKWLSQIGKEQFLRLIDIRICDTMGQKIDFERIDLLFLLKETVSTIYDEMQCLTLKDLAINGNDLIAAEVKEGIEIGTVLIFILDSVISGDLQNTREDLLCFINSHSVYYDKRSNLMYLMPKPDTVITYTISSSAEDK